MRRCETLKPVLPRSSPTNDEPSDEVKPVGPGMSMKPTSTSKEKGASSLEPSIAMATWWIPCRAEKRDMEAAKRFFKQAIEVAGQAPARVTTAGPDSYPRAIRETLGSDVLHRTNRSLNHRLEQDHRGMKQQYDPLRGFGSVASAARFCRAFDEVRQFFRFRTTMKQHVSLVQQREVFYPCLEALKALVLVA